jgi:hypothetical protein
MKLPTLNIFAGREKSEASAAAAGQDRLRKLIFKAGESGGKLTDVEIEELHRLATAAGQSRESVNAQIAAVSEFLKASELAGDASRRRTAFTAAVVKHRQFREERKLAEKRFDDEDRKLFLAAKTAQAELVAAESAKRATDELIRDFPDLLGHRRIVTPAFLLRHRDDIVAEYHRAQDSLRGHGKPIDHVDIAERRLAAERDKALDKLKAVAASIPAGAVAFSLHLPTLKNSNIALADYEWRRAPKQDQAEFEELLSMLKTAIETRKAEEAAGTHIMGK